MPEITPSPTMPISENTPLLEIEVRQTYSDGGVTIDFKVGALQFSSHLSQVQLLEFARTLLTQRGGYRNGGEATAALPIDSWHVPALDTGRHRFYELEVGKLNPRRAVYYGLNKSE